MFNRSSISRSFLSRIQRRTGWAGKHCESRRAVIPSAPRTGSKFRRRGKRLFLLVLVVAVVGGFVVLLYNKLVHLRVRSESAWADIDVQLKRRHDLIPNLVETVKG
ncbi:MAG: LemA family protein, partial [Terriglobales bacterium]